MTIEIIPVKRVIRQNKRKYLKKNVHDMKTLWYVTEKERGGVFFFHSIHSDFFVLYNNIEIGNESSNVPLENYTNYDLQNIYILSHFNILHTEWCYYSYFSTIYICVLQNAHIRGVSQQKFY